MDRLSFKSIVVKIAFFSFYFAQLQAMEGGTGNPDYSPRTRRLLQATSLGSTQAHPSGDLIYTAKSLDELIKGTRTVRTSIPEYDTKEKAEARFLQLTKLRKKMRNFLDPVTRTTRAYDHGVLLVGPSGVGKTSDAFAIGKYKDIKVVKIAAGWLKDPYQNSGSTKIARLYSLLADYGKPVILILDEINSLTEEHRVVGDNINMAMIDALILFMDEIKDKDVFVVFTSNGIKDYPPKFYSRLQKNTIYYFYPSREERIPIIKAQIPKYKLSLSTKGQGISKEVWTDYLADETEGLSFREIEAFFIEAENNALERSNEVDKVDLVLNQKDFKGCKSKVLKDRIEPSFLYKANKFFTRNSYTLAAVSIGVAAAGIGLAAILGAHHVLRQKFDAVYNAGRLTPLSAIPYLGSYFKDKAMAFAYSENWNKFRFWHVYTKNPAEAASQASSMSVKILADASNSMGLTDAVADVGVDGLMFGVGIGLLSGLTLGQALWIAPITIGIKATVGSDGSKA